MSRFSQSLLDFREIHSVLSSSTMPQLLSILRDKMKSQDAFARFEFDYFINVKAPFSKLEAPQMYRCAFTGIKNNGDYVFILEVNVVAASVCPCSREMSLLTNMDYENIKWNGDGNGYSEVTKKIFEDVSHVEVSQQVGMGAHNQRSNIRVSVVAKEGETIWIEDLVKVIESQASCPVYPILKRPDERWVTERGYNNAKFSEDITRDIQIALENFGIIDAWDLKVSNQESIHLYNAVCHQKSPNWKYHL